MISLNFSKAHRSILSFPPTSISDLSIITGVNGSGKSHFLEALKAGNIRVDGVAANDNDIRLFNWTNLIPANSGVADPIQLLRARSEFIRNLISLFKPINERFLADVTKIGLPGLAAFDLDALYYLDEQTFR